MQVIDWDSSDSRGRFTVLPGVDPELDDRRRVHSGLPDLLLRVAREEVSDLPDYMSECAMVYVPQIGYMLSVQPWRDGLTVSSFVPSHSVTFGPQSFGFDKIY